MKTLKYISTNLFSSIAAGMCIGIAGIVYLSQENKIIGSFLFSIGLLTILLYGFKLFTGMVGDITLNLINKKYKYILDLIIILIGNFLGTYIISIIIKLTNLSDKLINKANNIVIDKLNDTWYSLLILGILCGFMMYIAVVTYKSQNIDPSLSCIVVIISVMVFILAGFEHSIADMFYFALSNKIIEASDELLFIILGNLIGGNIIPILKILSYNDNK